MAIAGEGTVTLKLRKGDQEKLNIALKALAQRVDANTPIVLAEAGTKGADYCKENCPVDLGGLRASIGNPAEDGIFLQTRNSVTFGTAVDYALAVEEGVKARTIPIGKKGFLAWPVGPVAQRVKISAGGIERGELQYRTKKGKLTSKAKEGEWIFKKATSPKK